MCNETISHYRFLIRHNVGVNCMDAKQVNSLFLLVGCLLNLDSSLSRRSELGSDKAQNCSVIRTRPSELMLNVDFSYYQWPEKCRPVWSPCLGSLLFLSQLLGYLKGSMHRDVLSEKWSAPLPDVKLANYLISWVFTDSRSGCKIICDVSITQIPCLQTFESTKLGRNLPKLGQINNAVVSTYKILKDSEVRWNHVL